jgi:hypothetical protein
MQEKEKLQHGTWALLSRTYPRSTRNLRDTIISSEKKVIFNSSKSIVNKEKSSKSSTKVLLNKINIIFKIMALFPPILEVYLYTWDMTYSFELRRKVGNQHISVNLLSFSNCCFQGVIISELALLLEVGGGQGPLILGWQLSRDVWGTWSPDSWNSPFLKGFDLFDSTHIPYHRN